MLRDLHLLDGLAERRAIAGAVLAHHADLLRAFRLKLRVKLMVTRQMLRISMNLTENEKLSLHSPLLLISEKEEGGCFSLEAKKMSIVENKTYTIP